MLIVCYRYYSILGYSLNMINIRDIFDSYLLLSLAPSPTINYLYSINPFYLSGSFKCMPCLLPETLSFSWASEIFCFLGGWTITSYILFSASYFVSLCEWTPCQTEATVIATLLFNFCLWPNFSALPPPFLKIIFYINCLRLITSDELFSTYDFWPGCLFKFILTVVISTFACSHEVKNLGFSLRREALQGLKQEGCGATYILLRLLWKL